MYTESHDYSLFLKFIETYSPTGFREIDRNDSLLLRLEAMTEINNQFFHIADLIQARITWASKRCEQMIGIKPEELDAYHFMEATHPDDLEKHTLGRSKMFNTANDLYTARKGRALLSINLRIRNSKGEYPDLLFQLYFFYSEKFKTVFLFQVHTDIDFLKRRKHGYHYYVGDDFSNFRFPDEKLFLSVHTVNTHRRNILNKTSKPTMSELIFDFKEKRIL